VFGTAANGAKPAIQVPDAHLTEYTSVIGTGVTVDGPESALRHIGDLNTFRGLVSVVTKLDASDAASRVRADAALLSLGVSHVTFDAQGAGTASLSTGESVAFKVSPRVR
jgi:hypothetical protein